MSILNVPYFVQPDNSHCQATCLKMMAEYLDGRLGQPMQHRDIGKIKSSINNDPGRPSNLNNSWENFKWWLEREFPDVTFLRDVTTDEVQAINTIKTAIQKRFPVLVSTTHANTTGHIILVIGVMAKTGANRFREPNPGPVGEDLVFICHDPWGTFDPLLGDPRYGQRRYEGGYSSTTGEHGPGRSAILDLSGIRRSGAATPHNQNAFLLIRGNSILGA